MLERFSETEMIANVGDSAVNVSSYDLTTDELVERIVVWAQGVFGSEEFVLAKEEFYSVFGKVFPEDPFFDARMNYFLEYFVFLRLISSSSNPDHFGKTPYAVFQALKVDDKILAEDNRSLVHSIFQVVKHRDDYMMVKDLITGLKQKIVPKGIETFCGFGKNDIFQGFIYTVGEQSFVSHGVVMHPRRAEPVIRKIVKTAKKTLSITSGELLQKLAHLQVRAARHGHVNPKLIYSAPAR